MSSVRMQPRSAIRNHPNLFRHPKRLTIPKRLATTWGSTVRARPVGVSYTFLPEPRAIERPDPPPSRRKGAGLDAHHGRGLRGREDIPPSLAVARDTVPSRPPIPYRTAHAHRIALAPSPTLPAVDGPTLFIHRTTLVQPNTLKHPYISPRGDING